MTARVESGEEKMVRTTGQRIPEAALFALVLVVVPTPAEALELNGGVSLGWMQAGTVPHLAVGPRWAVLWRSKSGLLLSVHDQCSILPPIQKEGVGVYNQTSVAIGRAWKDGDFSVGPSMAIYSMTTCGVTLCGHVDGVAVGGHAQANMYLAGPLGLSVSAELDWAGGDSLVLPGGVAAMVVAGPVIRWSDQ
jgi:hypothetical protein